MDFAVEISYDNDYVITRQSNRFIWYQGIMAKSTNGTYSFVSAWSGRKYFTLLNI